MAQVRITDLTSDLPKLNRALADLEDARQQIIGLKNQLSNANARLKVIENSADIKALNNVTVTWTGPTTTLSWNASFVQDRKGHFLSIPAGSRGGLTANTDYWLAWNSIHQQMGVSTNLQDLLSNKNNIVICRVFTGLATQTATAGGGGNDTGGRALNDFRYKLF